MYYILPVSELFFFLFLCAHGQVGESTEIIHQRFSERHKANTAKKMKETTKGSKKNNATVTRTASV